MRKLGLIGGVGPESSIEYYRLIIDRFQDKTHSNDYPELIIHSINMTKMLNFINGNQLDKLVDFLLERVKVLELSGADHWSAYDNQKV